MTNITIGQMFTKEELKKAFKLIEDYFASTVVITENNQADARPPLNDMLKKHILTPETMARIEALVGHENNADYLAYVLQYAYTQVAGKTVSDSIRNLVKRG